MIMQRKEIDWSLIREEDLGNFVVEGLAQFIPQPAYSSLKKVPKKMSLEDEKLKKAIEGQKHYAKRVEDLLERRFSWSWYLSSGKRKDRLRRKINKSYREHDIYYSQVCWISGLNERNRKYRRLLRQCEKTPYGVYSFKKEGREKLYALLEERAVSQELSYSI